MSSSEELWATKLGSIIPGPVNVGLELLEGELLHFLLRGFLVKGKLKICMDDYVKNMLEDFPFKFNKDSKQETPAGNELLGAGREKLPSAEYLQIFHNTVTRGLYVS
ncbi:unnamed protein product [Cylindrotheca closterium]|uniref:Uncharacterized protein n=1 Tax=Cylindrotheca closterium TaxID=2856 RepID=A0AAD2CIF8_9STRA|nr:unnamed protein product [Cylindrotheca closterium]